MKKSILLLLGYLFFLMICFVAFAQTAKKRSESEENSSYFKSLEMPASYRHLVLKGERESQITVICEPQENGSLLQGIIEEGVLTQRLSNDTLYLNFLGSNHYRTFTLSVPLEFHSIESDGIEVKTRTSIFQSDQPARITMKKSHDDQRNVLDLILDQQDKAIALDLDHCITFIRHENSNATPPLRIRCQESRIQFDESMVNYPSPIEIAADDATYVSGNLGVTKNVRLTPRDVNPTSESLK